MGRKIITNMSFQTYEKKYKNYKRKLIVFSKQEIMDFDKQADTKGQAYVLNKKKWAKIGDKYYEIPKAPSFTWFKGLNAGAKLATCLVPILGIGALGGAGYGIYYLLNNNSGALIDASCREYADIVSDTTSENGSRTIVIKEKGDKTIESIDVTIGDHQCIKGEYSYGQENKDNKWSITIYKETLDKHKGAIVIHPKLSTSIEKVNIRTEGDVEKVNVGKTLQFYADITPSSASIVSKKWSIDYSSNAGNKIDESTGLFTARVSKKGEKIKVTITDSTGKTISSTKTIDVTDETIVIDGPRNIESTASEIKYTSSLEGVIWSVEEGNDLATIDASGNLTITDKGKTEGGTIEVKATNESSNKETTYISEIGTFDNSKILFDQKDAENNIFVYAPGTKTAEREKITGNIIIPSQYYDESLKQWMPIIGFYTNTEINLGAFEDCSGVDSFKIPETISTIGEQDFKNCNLVTINIPSTLKSFVPSSFGSLSKLQKVNFENPDNWFVTTYGILDTDILKTPENAAKYFVEYKKAIWKCVDWFWDEFVYQSGEGYKQFIAYVPGWLYAGSTYYCSLDITDSHVVSGFFPQILNEDSPTGRDRYLPCADYFENIYIIHKEGDTRTVLNGDLDPKEQQTTWPGNKYVFEKTVNSGTLEVMFSVKKDAPGCVEGGDGEFGNLVFSVDN